MIIRFRSYCLFILLALSACIWKGSYPSVQTKASINTATTPAIQFSATNTAEKHHRESPGEPGSYASLTNIPTHVSASDLIATITPDVTQTASYKDLRRIHYDEKSWSHFGDEIGLLYNDIFSIAIAPDQTLWFGGYSGYVLHFDNTSMISYTLPKDDAGDEIQVTNLLISKDNNIWIGTESSGVFRFNGKEWAHYGNNDGLTSGCTSLVLKLPEGVVWTDVPCDPSKFLLFNGVKWQPHWFENAPVELKYIDDIEVAPDGRLWVTAGYNLYRYDGVNWDIYPPAIIANVFRDAWCGIGKIKVAPDRSVWISDCYSLDLLHLLPENFLEVLQIPELNSGEQIGVIYVSQDGSVWIGPTSSRSEPGGIKNLLLQWDGARWTVYDQLPFNDKLFVRYSVRAIATQSDGTVWVATGMGIYRFKPEK